MKKHKNRIECWRSWHKKENAWNSDVAAGIDKVYARTAEEAYAFRVHAVQHYLGVNLNEMARNIEYRPDPDSPSNKT